MPKNLSRKNRPRLPPGQHITERFPVLQKGSVAHINRETYKLRIEGEIEYPKIYSFEDLKKLQDLEIVEDIHCVTSWSKFDTKWSGISFKKLFDIVKPKNTAKFIEFYCADNGFTTTVPMDRLMVDTAILALNYDEKPIDDKHGGPVRAVIPDLYFYKSAKWVIKITFLAQDKPGYWEVHGYSNKADPWKEQRYNTDD
ncbi:MAG: molybdopterin-dependent oxidoreductase [Promethearchaeota archaeon]